MTTDHAVLRDLASEEDYDACADLQRATWGDDFRELVGPALLKVTQKVGGIAAGAFHADGGLAAFVYGITGVREGALVHWSHMLAVRESDRDRGLGRRLKMHQRERVEALGIDRILWTFDPLVARNAHLNLNRICTRIIDYEPDMYGTSMHSRTDSVIGSDRFVVQWDLKESLVGHEAAPWPDVPAVGIETTTLPKEPTVLVEIPSDIQTLKRRDADTARAWREATRRAFSHYLRAGYRIDALVRASDTQRTAYVVTNARV